MNIQLKNYNAQQLTDLLKSEAYQNFPFCPITKHRAMAHIGNPSTQPNDVLLVLAFADDLLVGYVGVLVDEWFFNGQKIRLGWASTMLVLPQFRGQKIAQKLLLELCRAYGNKLVLAEFSDLAYKMFKRLPQFVPHASLHGQNHRFYFNLKEDLPQKWPQLKRLKPLLSLMDKAINGILIFINRPEKNSHTWLANPILDAETKALIAAQSTQDRALSLAKIQWIFEYPWVLKAENMQHSSYLFSDKDPCFEHFFLKIYHQNQLVSLLLMSRREHKVNLLACIGECPAHVLAQCIRAYMRQEKTAQLICFDKGINQAISGLKFKFSRPKERAFLMHQDLLQQLGKDFVFEPKTTDGDAMFT